MTLSSAAPTATAELLIDNRWQPAEGSVDVTDPADDTVVGSMAWGTGKDATRAADAAEQAFVDWSSRPARYRSDILLAGAEVIAERATQIAELLAHEAGKRLPEATGEVAFATEYFRWFRRAGKAFGRAVDSAGESRRPAPDDAAPDRGGGQLDAVELPLPSRPASWRRRWRPAARWWPGCRRRHRWRSPS